MRAAPLGKANKLASAHNPPTFADIGYYPFFTHWRNRKKIEFPNKAAHFSETIWPFGQAACYQVAIR